MPSLRCVTLFRSKHNIVSLTHSRSQTNLIPTQLLYHYSLFQVVLMHVYALMASCIINLYYTTAFIIRPQLHQDVMVHIGL